MYLVFLVKWDLPGKYGQLKHKGIVGYKKEKSKVEK